MNEFSPTTLADILGRGQVMAASIRPLWTPIPRIAGPAFTVRCPPGDNLMLHAAIHRAPAGSVIVVESGDLDYALAGGNVCAVAQDRGIAGFVVDGMIRDLAEVRERGFPVFGRGVIPIPGTKKAVTDMNVPVVCGGVTVSPADIVVADEEGIVVVPAERRPDVYAAARVRVDREQAQTLAEWRADHEARITALLAA
ncbi:RraA family protein [Hamadaea tsunoensis]|uniref:RraA family protein n=1 Tax=Hamadaea tsunoensis TaxID=53368 RepID=UPI000428253D|nr:RraA family protein [Hamadaea tsunoensis]